MRAGPSQVATAGAVVRVVHGSAGGAIMVVSARLVVLGGERHCGDRTACCSPRPQPNGLVEPRNLVAVRKMSPESVSALMNWS